MQEREANWEGRLIELVDIESYCGVEREGVPSEYVTQMRLGLTFYIASSQRMTSNGMSTSPRHRPLKWDAQVTFRSVQFELSEPPSDAISAVKFAPSIPSRLLVSSWDRHVYLYDTSEGDTGALLLKVEHHAPVLDICFGDDDTAYSAGLDCDVTKIDLETGRKTLLSTHDDGVKSVIYSDKHSLLISGSWDSTLHVHILDNKGNLAHAPATIPLPSKPFSLSLTRTKLVVAMASRAMHVYDLASLKMLTSQAAPSQESNNQNIIEIEPWQQRESSLKFMIRAICCTPDDAGYAAASIEGRIALDWFDPSEESQARKYAFKCHRQIVDDVDVVYPVNALAFHPIRTGTFASGGGDGHVALWDGKGKRRIRQYQGFEMSVASLSWSCDGKLLAVGVCPGFEDGKEDIAEGESKVFIRKVSENETKGKGN